MPQTHEFTLDQMSTPIGAMLVVSDAAGVLRALDWTDHEDRMLRLFRRQYKGVDVRLSPGRSPVVGAALSAYFAGEINAIDPLSVATGGTAFQRTVWAELRRISAGSSTSYGRLAARIGQARAVRAVGLANGANPIGIVVPCHRVIGSDGSLTGYGGGIARKRWLLEHEERWTGGGDLFGSPKQPVGHLATDR
jgi:methylated-DNA-[protein]-cysteine S-methyltransferase